MEMNSSGEYAPTRLHQQRDQRALTAYLCSFSQVGVELKWLARNIYTRLSLDYQ